MADVADDLATAVYDPATGVRLSPQFGEPTAMPSTQGMTLPEKFIRHKLSQLGDLLMAPGRALRGELPTYAIDPQMGEVHSSPEVMSAGAGLGGLAMTGGVAGTGAGGVALGAGPVRRAAAKKAAKTVEEGASSPANVAADATRLFDASRLEAVPAVEQFDLPRYTPPRGVPARVAELTNNPDVRAQMLDVIRQGQELGGAKWYNAEPLREAFLAELGKHEGESAFRQYMDFVAATSPRSDVGTNVRNASYYYTLARQGQPMPAVGMPNPQPYGHMAQRLHQQNAGNVVGAGWDPLQNPKPVSFAENLAGNQLPVTVDTHAFRLPAILAKDPRFLETRYITGKGATPRNIQQEVTQQQIPLDEAVRTPAFWQAQPKENEYAAIEQYYKGLARDAGLTPAQTQAAAWVGGGPLTGLASASDTPFVGFVADRAARTAAERGITPAEALSQMIRGKAPLLSVGGAAAVPYLLTTQDEGGT